MKEKARDFIRRSIFITQKHQKQQQPMDTKPEQQEQQQQQRYSFNPTLVWNSEVESYLSTAYGPLKFSRISEALTRPSCYSCIRVNTIKSTPDSIIEKLRLILKENGAEISKCEIPGLEYLVFVKGSGPHSIDYGFSSDGNEKPPKEILVSRKCAEAVIRGAEVYVPGVLACSAHVEKGDEVAVSVSVEQPGGDGGWVVGITRGTVLQGSELDPYHVERSGLYIGKGTAAMTRSGIFRAPEGIAVDFSNRVYNLPSFRGVLEGEIFLQNLPSIVTAHALDPQKGERILDMCAAPGGKTTAIAICMKDEGEIIAADRSHNKVLDIQKLAAEMGLSCITTCKLDALKAVRSENEFDSNLSRTKDNNDVTIQESNLTKSEVEKIESTATEGLNAAKDITKTVSNENANERTYISRADVRKEMRRKRNGPGRNQLVGGKAENSKGFAPKSFDRVLLDAPCSALGLRPRLFAGEETVESLRKHANYQRKMFQQAVQLVRPGGVLVYSTCTINPGENEAVVRYALDTYKFLSLAPQNPRIGGPGLVGRFEFPNGYIEEWLRPGEEELVQRFDPSSALDTIGFFIAKFIVGSNEVDLEKSAT